ncbi:MAG: hypothetical protein KA099_03660 [Alphaproteobacteria bacterium]|nr:hypothetical protein [Alphaproteobacteria bacterium]MBP7758443.1 hypothetical protein [Alphaproteobacteria bacterium]MBP7762724.1 hypothetical protein [Alphaproteobacteria bacterium]MBP7904402.1 hypothetical protein [Alphaproteobacteria bacterium]
MLLLWIYIAANLYMALLTWTSYRKMLHGRGHDFRWTFDNGINLFLYWVFITSSFEIAFFHSHSLGVFLLNVAQVAAFIGLIKIGTKDFFTTKENSA